MEYNYIFKNCLGKNENSIRMNTKERIKRVEFYSATRGSRYAYLLGCVKPYNCFTWLDKIHVPINFFKARGNAVSNSFHIQLMHSEIHIPIPDGF